MEATACFYMVIVVPDSSVTAPPAIAAAACQQPEVRAPRRGPVNFQTQWKPATGARTCMANIKMNSYLHHAMNKHLETLVHQTIIEH